MNYNQALKFLYKLKGKKYNLDLGAIKGLLSKLSNPQDKLKVIHIAGTNGKGSTAAMLSSILKEAGYKVGLYTSPHLIEFNERFQINKKKITDKDILKYFNKIYPYYENETFFEFTTALAFLYFYEKKVDFLILEVGMGGRLDATNVITPLVSVITNISLEHQQYLGKNIRKIAYEKAGIIKNNVPVVTGATGSALTEIKKIAKKRKSKIHIIKNSSKSIKLNLNGKFQKNNALLAIKTIELLKKDYKITKSDIKKGLLNIKWPGRLHFLTKNILVDCAHNLDAIKTIKKDLIKIKKQYKKLILITGIMSDKSHKEMLKELETLSDFIILTQPKIERSENPRVLFDEIKVKNKKIIKNVKAALNYAKKIATKDDLIFITGSIFTVGEALGRE